MTSRYFVFFAACFALCASSDLAIDSKVLQDVFGYRPGQAVPVAAASNIQASAVKPADENGTLVDLDYWDSDIFSPAPADYDKFDWTLTKRVASSSEQNFLLSPLGLKLALAILTEAATGVTQNELSSVLGFDLDRNLVRRKFSTIIESLQKESPQYILNLGSRIYIADSAQPRQRFAAIAQEFYKTELKTVNFLEPAVAAKDINTWVSNITQGRIPTLVDEDDVANMVVLVLNTLYFKGSWRHQFNPNATKNGQFYVTDKIQKTIPFMTVNDKFYYSESTKYDAKVLRMPYMGNKYAMYIIVPNSLTGLPRVLTYLSDLRQELNNLREYLVDVTLPKFKFDYTSQLDGILRELGVRAAFEDTASFPGIARGQLLDQRLKVSKVLQRSGIEVNELGSVAYSATEISLVNKFGEDTEAYAEVIANKPFLFFIQDEATRQLLFTGRVADPSLADGAFKLN
uniref:Serpin domain-containing protein n=1 Tax=Heliothis virescens TaxID=7102 RepID=A0A2A4K0E7_HELVI